MVPGQPSLQPMGASADLGPEAGPDKDPSHPGRPSSPSEKKSRGTGQGHAQESSLEKGGVFNASSQQKRLAGSVGWG